MASADLRKELECSVCLTVFTDPVTLRCGHNFCRACIDCVLDTQEETGCYSCPECREEYQERPALQRNRTLRNIAENLLTTPPDQVTTILCTYCIHSPVPAVKSCLHCEASLCEDHLRVHSKSPEHVLLEPTTSLENRKCSVHKEILKYYCTEEAKCICVSCSLAGEHRGHQVETLDEASGKKKEKMRDALQKLMTEREKTEKRAQSLQERRREVQEEAAGETARVTAMFRDLRRRLADLEKRVLSDISRRAECRALSDWIQQLEIKKAELSRKMGDMEELCHMTDPLTVLQQSDTGDLCDTEEGGNEDRQRHDEQLHDGGGLDVAGISHTLHTGLSDIIRGVTGGVCIAPADILLDVNTAHNNLHITDDRKTVSRSDIEQNRPETPERFQDYSQVLSSRSFSSGRHYWEVDVGGSHSWRVGMCYPSIDRREGQSLLAAMASADLKKELECSVCLNVYTDPVILRCGHNFCRACIDRVLDTQEETGCYSCPECREEYQERPALQRNRTLRNIAENLLTTPPDQVTTILCTYCIHSPVPAVKSCLMCEASLCEDHLRVHSKSPEHVLLDPTTSLENRKCSVHKEILKYYCTEDAKCICVSCSLAGEHRGHQVETLDEASGKKKERLREALQKLMTERQETEKRAQSLQERRREVQEEAAGETARVTAMFRDLRRRLEDLEKRVLSDISRQAECRALSDWIQQLEIKKAELSRKMGDMEELCHMTDPLTVLQQSDTGDLCDTEEGGNEDRQRHDEQLHDEGGLDVAGISHTLHTGLSDIIRGVTGGVCIAPADILLDVNTAYNILHISDDRKTVSRSDIKQNRPETPERFQIYPQVLSSRSFSSGRHYWEVDVGGSDSWRVGMCYPSMDRRGLGQSLIGNNNKSWVLYRYNNQYKVRHDSKVTAVGGGISSNRVRVKLDYEAGLISFYDLCDPIRHLHTFTTTFTEPLHAALCVGRGCIKISDVPRV
ncbi:E3 ubiquitin/ISG15 ligase TRIM25-like [Gastrophryne carolinensis]